MLTLIDLAKRPNENEEQYIWRLGQAKDSGVIDLDWDEIADLVNAAFRDEDVQYKEAAYRKPYQQAKRFYEADVFCPTPSEDAHKMQAVIQDLRKERQKVSDERNELSRLLREQARKEAFVDMVKRVMADTPPLPLQYEAKEFYESNTDLIVSLTDIHAGIKIDNHFNSFDYDILRKRINSYLSEIIQICERHQSQDCHVVIGEVISGLIHETLRIESNENIVEQFKTVAVIIADFLSVLSNYFRQVNVYVTPGNHSRLVAKKEISLKGENMDVFLPFYLQARLQNFENIVIHENDVDSDIAMFNVWGNVVMAAHGDKDSPETVVQKFTMMFGVKPDLVYLGHRHTNGLLTVYDTKVIESGCISGTDTYAVDKRLKNAPEQTVSVVDRTGLVALYDIKLDQNNCK